MDSCRSSNSFDVKEVLDTLREIDTMHIHNEELCYELGKQREKCRNLEHIIQSTKLEIEKRDFLIHRVLKDNEALEAQLGDENTSKLSPETENICLEKEQLKKELEECQRAYETLKKELELKFQISKKMQDKEKEEVIGELEKSLNHDIEEICEQLEKNRELNVRLRKEIRLVTEYYEVACIELQVRTEEFENLQSEFDNCKRSVACIKEIMDKNNILEPE